MRALISITTAFALAAGLSACAAALTPMQAIFAAATAAPEGVPGVFVMQVRNAGRQDGRLFLNSEADYRDQRSLTVAISPSAFAGLEARFGRPLDTALVGQRIAVTGEARRTRIDFTGNGLPTGKYYFQTHVVVTDADQIALR